MATMPPSPRLSARRIKIAYFSDTTMIRAQKITETAPTAASPRRGAPGRGGLDGLLQGIERARADVPVDDAECAERYRQGQAGGRRFGVGLARFGRHRIHAFSSASLDVKVHRQLRTTMRLGLIGIATSASGSVRTRETAVGGEPISPRHPCGSETVPASRGCGGASHPSGRSFEAEHTCSEPLVTWPQPYYPRRMTSPAPSSNPKKPKLLQVLGPGLITGASDDDPSGIATYSQAGAQYGFQLGWTLLFTWPLMCVIQEISARIGRVTGRGLAGVLKRHVPAPVLYLIVGLLVLANAINIGADLGAMAAALQLLVGGPTLIYVVGFGIVTVLLEAFMRYSRYVSVLKWLTLSLFAYVGVAFVVHVPWGTVLHSLVVPSINFDSASLTVVVAVLGTTISPYLFFWQASEEVEEVKERSGAKPLSRAPEQARAELGRIRVDTYLGMGFSNLVALFIVITTAATLHASGTTDIQTSAQAAEALRPIAGPFVFFVFALGIIGTGLLALPVLAGSCAYAVGESSGLACRAGPQAGTGEGLLRHHRPRDPRGRRSSI